MAYFIAAGVAVQAASVALGFFTIINEVEDGGVFSTGYNYESNLGLMIHRYVGMGLIPLSALILLILSFFLRTPDTLRWAAAVFGLVVLQIGFVFVAFSAPWGGALHGLNALAVSSLRSSLHDVSARCRSLAKPIHQRQQPCSCSDSAASCGSRTTAQRQQSCGTFRRHRRPVRSHLSDWAAWLHGSDRWCGVDGRAAVVGAVVMVVGSVLIISDTTGY